MIALDTNVIVRFVTNDDPVQSPKARGLIEVGDAWVSTTVILETEWVLRGAYRRGPAEIVRILRAFLGLPQVAVQDAVAVDRALELCSSGMDFADALHLASSGLAVQFATFDRDLRRRAAQIRGIPQVIEP